MIGHVVFNSAYATIIIQARMATLTDTLEAGGGRPRRDAVARVPPRDPAADPAGGDRRRTPDFSFSFDDVVTSLFLGGSDVETLPVLLLGLIRLHVTPEVNAIGVLVMITTTGLLALAAVLASVRGARSARASCRRRRRRRERPLAGAAAVRLVGSSVASATCSPCAASTSRSREGEFFSLIGPSGCGKTTTLRMISGLRASRPAAAIEVHGRDMTRVPPHRRPVNTVFQTTRCSRT